MMDQIRGMETVLRGIWELVGTEVDPETYAFSREAGKGITLLLLTDQEMEQLCLYYAERLRRYVVGMKLVGWLDCDDMQCRQLTETRLVHLAEVWSEDKVQSILARVFDDSEAKRELVELWGPEWDPIEQIVQECRAPALFAEESEPAERDTLPF